MDGALTFRRPTPDDHARIHGVIDEWWGHRSLRQLLPRLYLEHMASTSWVAETADGRLVGFLVGFVSPDHPDTAYAHMIGTDPNVRKRGVGRALYERFFADVASRGVGRVTAITWPGNRQSVAFHRAMGFRIDDGPSTTPIYGTPSHADHDGEGEDRVVFIRDL